MNVPTSLKTWGIKFKYLKTMVSRTMDRLNVPELFKYCKEKGRDAFTMESEVFLTTLAWSLTKKRALMQYLCGIISKRKVNNSSKKSLNHIFDVLSNRLSKLIYLLYSWVRWRKLIGDALLNRILFSWKQNLIQKKLLS